MVDKKDKINKTEEQWQQELNPDQYRICREKGTERAFTGEYYTNQQTGEYLCTCCGGVLFRSEEKYDSGSGWPSFWQPATGECLEEHHDKSHGMIRTEVTCARCDAHLGHLFPDGPQPTGLRYCINSASLHFKGEGDS